MDSRPLAVLRFTAGAILVVFGAAKFADHGAEAASFDRYGLPDPNLFVYAIGALELGLGVLLGLAPALLLVLLVLTLRDAGRWSLDRRVGG
jgi:uncharacterized membrane protein YphA (DoxX/SURF4 family)